MAEPVVPHFLMISSYVPSAGSLFTAARKAGAGPVPVLVGLGDGECAAEPGHGDGGPRAAGRGPLYRGGRSTWPNCSPAGTPTVSPTASNSCPYAATWGGWSTAR